MNRTIFLASLILINSASAGVFSPFVHPDTVPASSWSANWIGIEPTAVTEVDLTGASWIWSAEDGIDPAKNAKPGIVHFRKNLTLSANDPLVSARVIMGADNHFALSVNGQDVGKGESWRSPQIIDITRQLKPGNSVISLRATNDPDEGAVNAAGLIGKIALLSAGQKTQTCVTDGSWEWSTDQKSWKPVHVIGAIGAAPWSNINTNSVPKAGQQSLWSCYRKEFTLVGKPKKAIARIAVDSKYWLWGNGVMVVSEGALKRGPTPTDTFFDEVDLAPHLCTGRTQGEVVHDRRLRPREGGRTHGRFHQRVYDLCKLNGPPLKPVVSHCHEERLHRSDRKREGHRQGGRREISAHGKQRSCL